jgi:hypothetical protein
MSKAKTLKDKQRKIRVTFPDCLGLRVHRSISWLTRAEKEAADLDVCFILLWISFNSAYASDIEESDANERASFKKFFSTLIKLDNKHRVYDAVWTRFSQEIRILLDNKYIFGPFWSHQNGLPGYERWEDRLEASKKSASQAMKSFDTPALLAVVFDRLYVLRNQIIHGGSTWNSSVNRRQVQDGVSVLSWLLPIFIDIMMDNPKQDWGKPFYPVVEPGS